MGALTLEASPAAKAELLSGLPETFAPAGSDGFAADMLAAPARTQLAEQAAASWLAPAPAGPSSRVATPALLGPQPAGFTPRGAVRAWGYNQYGELGNNSTTTSTSPVTVSNANGFTNTGVTAIAAGGFHSLALRGGVVYSWGYNFDGELGNTRRPTPPCP